MKDNVFWQNRKTIQILCQKHNVKVGAATRMFIQKAKLTDYKEDLAVWNAECRRYMMDKGKTLDDLFS